jgi:hypothetical protein
MAKKDAASKRLIRPKTTADYLARLPQFEPRPIPFADLEEYDVQQLLNSILSRGERVSAFEAIQVEGMWVVLLDNFDPAVGARPRVLGFPREQDAREFVRKVSSGLSADEALQNLRKVQREQGIDAQEEGKQRIDDVLSEFMTPHIRDATKLKPFLKDAKRAIAGYVGARETEYDRRRAKKLLSDTSIALETTERKLQEIAQWPELSNYLKRLHRDAMPVRTSTSTGQWLVLEEQPQPSSRKQVEQELQRRADLDTSYSQFAPNQIRLRLSQLERVVSLADERVTFGPGDAQRDQIAQDFTDQLASAWHSATERNPTYSRSTPRPSPFARLLETINQRLLNKRHQSPNNFFEYGAKAIKRLPSAKPRRSRRPRVVGTPRRVAASGN